ncbi:MAG: hypothetical protein WAQ52_00310 [Terriglobales bacterium]
MAELPRRIFLDSCTLQTLQCYGEYIYDGAEIPPNDKLWGVTNGIQNVEALRKIVLVYQRAPVELALSRSSLDEVLDKRDGNYLGWTLEVLGYWEECRRLYECGFTGEGDRIARRLSTGSFGYLSVKDKRLVRDAVAFECDVFLTVETKLPKNAKHLQHELGIRILQPTEYWEMLKPYAPLSC